VGKLSEEKNPTSASEDARNSCNERRVFNGILLAIPEQEYEVLRRHLEYIELPNHFVIYEPGAKISYGYFLNEGLTSLIVSTTDGRTVEVGIVGKEGFVGAPLAVKLDRSPYGAVVQIAGSGCRIKSQALEDVLESTPGLRFLLHRAAQLQGQQFAQIAACNRLHELEQRLARWLLMSQDRVNAEWMPVTHDFLANMLGTGRPSVTITAGNLQKAGLIEYTRGALKILNRKGLEAASCECYRNIVHFSGGSAAK
jgi:CRP-like cAMP-binding protein